MRKVIFLFVFFISQWAMAQNATLEGYIYESKNRGYLNQVKVMVLESKTGIVKAETQTDPNGHFTVEVPGDTEYRVGATKEMFLPASETVFVKNIEKSFVKVEMNRKPGYLMDVTLAEKRIENMPTTDGLIGTRFEVYNNTTGQEVYRNDSTSSTNIQFHMEQGNHYTYLVRKKGFFSKRIEAYVNVKGCILCIDGIDKVTPGITDNLTQGFQEGVLLANLELQPLRLNSTIEIKNILYDLGSAALRPESRKELDKLGMALKDNPYINVELSSHTDARGDNASNLNLSQCRAESVVDYLVKNIHIDPARLTAQGYGESKLVNRCADGVTCSEVEHQQNRRTELKILKIDDSKLFEKSLAEMIREENIDKTIEQIQKSDVIEVKDGEEMPDDLKKYIEEQKRQEQKNNPAKTETPVKKKDNESTSAEVKETKVTKETTVATTSKIIVEKPIRSSVSIKKVRDLDGNFSAYTIEILTNEKPLAATNEVFTRYDLLTVETTKKGVVYYAGSFQKLIEAEDFLKNKVITRYPKAKIVRFENGIKL